MSDYFGEADKTFQPKNIQQNVQKSDKQSIDHYQDESNGDLYFKKDIQTSSGVSSLVFGILSWVLTIIPFLFPILAIRLSKKSNTKKAKAGKILGILGIIKDILLIIIIYLNR